MIHVIDAVIPIDTNANDMIHDCRKTGISIEHPSNCHQQALQWVS